MIANRFLADRQPVRNICIAQSVGVGFLLAFWAAPVMTLAHLVFAVATTGYILIAMQLEERDLVPEYGSGYEEYRRRVPMLLPFGRSGA